MPAGADEHGHLSLPGRLTCGALAGMTGTALTHPLDTVRLRLALPNSGRGACIDAQPVQLSGCCVTPCAGLQWHVARVFHNVSR